MLATETSPVAAVSRPKAKHASLPAERRLDLRSRQRRPPFGVEMRIVDVDGTDLPHDGVAFYDGQVARWCRPDDVVFVDERPHTATGKLRETRLRADYRDRLLAQHARLAAALPDEGGRTPFPARRRPR